VSVRHRRSNNRYTPSMSARRVRSCGRPRLTRSNVGSGRYSPGRGKARCSCEAVPTGEYDDRLPPVYFPARSPCWRLRKSEKK
jgi:hypothetical protein